MEQTERFFIFLFVILTLGVILYAVMISVTHPDVIGFWSFTTGEVFQLTCGEPTNCPLQVGDIIKSVDGEPVWKALSLAGKKIGDEVTIVIDRDGKENDISVVLQKPGSQQLITQIIPILIGFVFWLSGFFILSFSRYNSKIGLITLSLQGVALALSSGNVAALSGEAVAWLFAVVRIVVGPVTLLAHLKFPAKENVHIKKSFLLILLGFTIFLLLVSFTQQWPVQPAVSTPGYLWLLGNLAITVVILGRKLRKTEPLEVRRKAGVISITIAISLVVFIFGSLLPEIVLSKPVVPYEISTLTLLLIPIAYGLAVFHDKLIRFERYVNRTAAFVIVMITIGMAYVLIYSFILKFLPANVENPLGWGLAITVLLALIAGPLYNKVNSWVTRFLYGGWYDQFSVVQTTTQSLSEAKHDVESIAQTFCKSLCNSMRLDYVNLLLDTGILFHYSLRERDKAVSRTQIGISISDDVCSHLDDLRRISLNDFKSFLNDPNINQEKERNLLGSHPVWVYPLCESISCQGLLVLGRKLGDEPFSAKDYEILDVIIHQTSISIQNIKNLKQIEKMHHRLIQAREDERKHIANDLHDRTIQSLIGVNYALNSVRDQVTDGAKDRINQIRDQIREINEDLRKICSNLRPTTLDILGLVPAIHAKVEELQPELPFTVEVHSTGDTTKTIPEQVSLCIFRFFQEAITNVRKHSAANLVIVLIDIGEECISIDVWDNGSGFSVPQNIKELSVDKHFGLVSLQEMVEGLSGKMEIISEPDNGCTVRADLPIKADT